MPVTSSALLDLAERLHRGETGGGEASLRAAISRAYYAAVIHLRDRLIDTPGATAAPEAGLHGYLRRALRDSKRTHLTVLAQKLGTLHELRENADYQTRATGPTANDVAGAIKRSRELIASIDNLAPAEVGRIRA